MINITSRKIPEREFIQALESYLLNEDEQSLNLAYEFGRLPANVNEISSLDIIQIHHRTLSRILHNYQSKIDQETFFNRAATFITEAMISVEMRNRGFESTVQQLRDQNRDLNSMNRRLEEEVDKRKRMNVLLKQNQSYVQSIIDNSLDSITIVDENGEFLFLSPSSINIIGYSPEELKKTNIFEKIHPDDLDNVMVLFNNVVTIPFYVIKIEYRFKHKDGSWRYFESIARNLLNHFPVRGILINSRDITERKEAEEEIRKSREMLRKLAERIEEVREEKRLDMAREIHDELGQMLTVLKIDLSLLRDNILQNINYSVDRGNYDIEHDFKTMFDRIDTIILSVQRIINELRPQVLDKLGFEEALRWELKNIQKRTHIDFNFQNNVKSYVISDLFNEKQLLSIFRIFQESITNVIRHADATKVDVQLNKIDSQIQLLIVDNGKGIKESELKNADSFGIIGMRERALSLGGDFKIEGRPEKGTKVIISLPFIGQDIENEINL
ncbi:MAG TPA: PAS domain S-box protein [Balneolales bacterium]|nr:PAS domain S-box protein [Balneolales bacterium]